MSHVNAILAIQQGKHTCIPYNVLAAHLAMLDPTLLLDLIHQHDLPEPAPVVAARSPNGLLTLPACFAAAPLVEAFHAMQADNRVAAVKALRGHYDLGLKESLDLVYSIVKEFPNYFPPMEGSVDAQDWFRLPTALYCDFEDFRHSLNLHWPAPSEKDQVQAAAQDGRPEGCPDLLWAAWLAMRNPRFIDHTDPEGSAKMADKVGAIKAFRAYYGLGLKEAKDMMEALGDEYPHTFPLLANFPQQHFYEALGVRERNAYDNFTTVFDRLF